MKAVYIIAEAGVNHNGSMELAMKMIEEAKRAGADAVKFQTFISKELVCETAPKAEYQLQAAYREQSQREMLKQLELSFEQFRQLNDYAKYLNIDFISTPFDFESIEFLKTIEMPYWKIPSGEITNLPYLMKLAETKRPIILSTGMSTLEEIEEALQVFIDYKREDITLLQCNTEYPTPYADVNLHVMKTLKEKFKVNVGYSDHTKGWEVAIAAAALGADVIEKHFTLSRKMEGPDHLASLEPQELKNMIESIRHIEMALGNEEKKVSSSEKKNIAVARKSIVAKNAITKGEIYTEDNITVKRPGNGISPMKWFEVLGSRAGKDFEQDELIE